MVVRIVLNHLGGVVVNSYILVVGGTNSLNLGGVCGGTKSLILVGFVVVRIVLDHLGGVCGGKNSLKSSWWGLCY